MLHLRQARAEDTVAIVTLLGELGYDLPPEPAAAFAIELLADPAHVLLVAEADGRVVGFANANLRPQLHHLAAVCTLDELVVADGSRTASARGSSARSSGSRASAAPTRSS